ncbi:ribonuclease HI [Bosea sp. ANAM02]|uniref:ribonuclease HI n=1 Tax=Bosea sp. ANAM02 TaxID=2020412 RepID=UPI00140F0373|nr:ribonuclease HI [Bosea sp. ANAM02]BCB21148.1 ribonuclease H [Bosea sp. ANAM02]
MSTQTSNGPALIFTDGACIGNPGPGGYAAVIQIGDAEQVIVGREESTTNNRMEMTAAIMALDALPAGLGAVVHSDSEYVVKGITEWLPGWKQRGWRTAAKKPVLNQDLWERLEALAAARKVTWTWVRGHAGHELNERVDGLANAEAQKAADANGWVPGSRFGFKPL